MLKEKKKKEKLILWLQVQWFGERDGHASEPVSPREFSGASIGIWGQRRQDVFSEDPGADADAAAGGLHSRRRRSPTPHGAEGLDENLFGAPDTPKVPEGIPEDREELRSFKLTMLGQDRGPECFITNQAAFVVRRIEALRESNQLELAEQFGAVHRDLLHRLDQCLNPEGFAEQYVYMLHEGSIIENMYARREEEIRAADSSELHDGENEFDEREKYRGSLSEYSDPDGWLE